MGRLANLGRHLSLLALLMMVLWLAIQQLYAGALSGYSSRIEVQNHQALEALLTLEYSAFPHSAVRTDIVQRARLALSDDVISEAAAIARARIYYSPSDSLAWYHWLDLALSQSEHFNPIERAEAVRALSVLARNEPDYRLHLARMGLKYWYQLTSSERQAFLEHITWVATISPNVLWGHASLLGRTHLLCRLNSQQSLGVALCRPD